jgi:sugar fermentation stimulation protein A
MQMGAFRLFNDLRHARFLGRPNRFLVRCELDGAAVEAFLPNPGRLHELLLPDSTVYLVEEGPSPQRKTIFTAVAVEREGHPVMLHTHRTNDVARHILEAGLAPGLEGARIVRAEVPMGHSRFDFLLSREGREVYLEVKSCTLVGKETAMFPDAVTARGARHLRELQELSLNGVATAVLFVVHWPFARCFMPDYHTDLNFARSFLAVRDVVKVIPLAVRWRPDLSMDDEVRLLDVPWDYIQREAHDRGSYLLILRLPGSMRIPTGSLGSPHFREGFYIYVGSAMANLSRRVERHLRLRKRHHWHIDGLRAVSEVHAALPIRSSTKLECGIADAVSAVADWKVAGFGSSDCSCSTHLFGMEHDPLNSRSFHSLLEHFRMDRYRG